MNIESIATASAKWLWDKYGKDLADIALGDIKKKLQKFKWQEAETKYRERLYELYSTTRLLGHHKAVKIDEIFTDVYVLDRVSAFRRYDFSELESRPFERKAFLLDDNRKPALRLVLKEKRLFILGKPGAGKTTLLKFITIQACAGKIQQTPIFIWLKEWSESGLDIISFLVKQFDICSFPNAQLFVEHLLGNGNALLLFDGLDEVNQDGEQRAQMISLLTEFSKRYPSVQMCITCRIAATDYSFDNFTYLEIADFDDKQIRQFVSKWYGKESPKSHNFLSEFTKPENISLKELAKTPLLLALLCLAYDETLTFPYRRVDIYREAIDALLKKWDASRGIKRDEVYRRLSIGRKEQLLENIAYENFKSGSYFIRKDVLLKQINHYLQQLPIIDTENLPESELILTAIQEQHGLFVERAYGIYSFSHLTFQEYFAAKYIINNNTENTLDQLSYHITDDSWHEIFLSVASLLNNADYFFEILIKKVAEIPKNQSRCEYLINWASSKAELANKNSTTARAAFIVIALALDCGKSMALANSPDRKISRALAYARSKAFDLAVLLDGAKNIKPNIDQDLYLDDFSRDIAPAFKVAQAFAQNLANIFGVKLSKDELNYKWNLSPTQAELMTEYIIASRLLIECLKSSAVSNRTEIENSFLLLKL